MPGLWSGPQDAPLCAEGWHLPLTPLLRDRGPGRVPLGASEAGAPLTPPVLREGLQASRKPSLPPLCAACWGHRGHLKHAGTCLRGTTPGYEPWPRSQTGSGGMGTFPRSGSNLPAVPGIELLSWAVLTPGSNCWPGRSVRGAAGSGRGAGGSRRQPCMWAKGRGRGLSSLDAQGRLPGGRGCFEPWPAEVGVSGGGTWGQGGLWGACLCIKLIIRSVANRNPAFVFLATLCRTLRLLWGEGLVWHRGCGLCKGCWKELHLNNPGKAPRALEIHTGFRARIPGGSRAPFLPGFILGQERCARHSLP